MPKTLSLMGFMLLMFSIALLSIPALQPWDHQLIALFAQYRTPLLNDLAGVLAILGGMPVVLCIMLLCCAVQMRYKNMTKLLLIIAAVLGSILLSWLLKFLVSRPRPDAMWAIFESYGQSFPSGHSVYAATFAALMLLIMQTHQHRHIFYAVAGVWLLLMGWSRVYLGVHFLSDVLAGWAIGLIWVALLWQFLHTKFSLKLLGQYYKLDKN